MTKQLPKLDIELITRAELCAMTRVSRFKIDAITLIGEFRFPEPVCRLAHNEKAYNRVEVLAWLKNNDMKKITRVSQIYQQQLQCPDHIAKTRAIKQQKDEPNNQTFDNSLAAAFISGSHNKKKTNNPTKQHAKTTVIHLQERNDFIPPHSHLTQHSNGGDHYRITLPGFWG